MTPTEKLLRKMRQLVLSGYELVGIYETKAEAMSVEIIERDGADVTYTKSPTGWAVWVR